MNPFAVVKECKGAAIAILVLLETNQQLGGGAVTQEWLERHSGYADKPVSQALAYLSETGRIRHTLAGCTLAEPAAPTDLPVRAGVRPAPTEPAPLPAEQPAGTSLRPAPAKTGPLDEEPGRKLSDSPTATSASDHRFTQIQAEAEEKGAGIIPTRASLEHLQANLAALKCWGVGRNEKTIGLAARLEVTPQQIEAIAKRLIRERRFSTGLLITAVQCDYQPGPQTANKYAPRPEVRDPGQYAQWEE